MTRLQASLAGIAAMLVPSASAKGASSLPRNAYRRVLLAFRLSAGALLALSVLLTPGFMSTANVLTLLTTTSLVGCVACGMTFITLSGNVMSFCLGATLSATTIVFMASLPSGLTVALIAAFAFSAFLTGFQGWIVGYFRANPIIVSMAVLPLIYGFVTFFTGGRGIYPEGSAADLLKGRVAGVPIPVVACAITLIAAQLILSGTRFGRNILMVGSNARAARAAGIETWRTVAGSYLVAGTFTAVSAVLMASRYGSGDMEHGIGFDYLAISAVIVGGNAIEGGRGSALKTILGAVAISVVQALLLLWGFSTAWQNFATGVIVLAVIMLQTLETGR
jgi:ribose/xylose/arabinose/galactoside ABC-type transport system permease subunit